MPLSDVDPRYQDAYQLGRAQRLLRLLMSDLQMVLGSASPSLERWIELDLAEVADFLSTEDARTAARLADLAAPVIADATGGPHA